METKKEYEISMFKSEAESEFKFYIKTFDFSEVKTLALLAGEVFPHVYVMLDDEIMMSIHDYSEEENDFQYLQKISLRN